MPRAPLIGLLRGKAPAAKLALFPLPALPITALAVLFVAMLRDSLVGGFAAARAKTDLSHKRSTRVKTAPGCNESRAGKEGRVITIAGIPLPPTDEARHFKVVGTTGTGKSTAIRELHHGALGRLDAREGLLLQPKPGLHRAGERILRSVEARLLSQVLLVSLEEHRRFSNIMDVSPLAVGLHPQINPLAGCELARRDSVPVIDGGVNASGLTRPDRGSLSAHGRPRVAEGER